MPTKTNGKHPPVQTQLRKNKRKGDEIARTTDSFLALFKIICNGKFGK
jgi:hypothetical protein